MSDRREDPRTWVDDALIALILVGMTEVVGVNDGQLVYASTGVGRRSYKVRLKKLVEARTIQNDLIDGGLQLGWDL